MERSPGRAPGSVGNAELYCLSYDRKTKKNRHLQIYSGRRFFAGGLSELQELCILKIKNPTLLSLSRANLKIVSLKAVCLTRLMSSLDWVSVRSCRNRTKRLIYPNGRLSLSR